MSSIITTFFRGLIKNKNSFQSPQGSLNDCENFILTKEGILECRSGLRRIGSFEKNEIKKLISHNSKKAIFFNSEKILNIVPILDKLIIWTETGIWITKNSLKSNFYFSDLNKISDQVIHSIDSYFLLKDSIYFLNNKLIKKIVISKDGRASCFFENFVLPKPYDIVLAKTIVVEKKNSDSTNATFINSKIWLSYRICYKRISIDGSVTRSAPSNRINIFSDKKSNKKEFYYVVNLYFYIHPYLRDEDVVEFYRSSSVNGYPSDDMILVDVRSCEEVRSTMRMLDNNLSLLGDELIHDSNSGINQYYLYTSPNQEGIKNQNESFPLCRGISSYRNMLALLCPEYHQKFIITLFDFEKFMNSSGSLIFTFECGLRKLIFCLSPRTLERNGAAFFTDSDDKNHWYFLNIAICQFNSDSSNDFLDIYNITENIDDKKIFKFLFKARYPNEKPIKFYIEEVSEALKKFIKPLHIEDFVFFEKEKYFNRIVFSKSFDYDSIPFYRFIDIGDSKKLIIATQENMGYFYVFKEDGIFRISGYDAPNFFTETIDPDLQLISNKAIVLFNSFIYALTYRGLIKLGYDSFDFVCKPIEDEITKIMQWGNASNCCVVKNPIESQILILCFSNENLKIFDTVFVYHELLSEWTKWSIRTQGMIYHNFFRTLLSYSDGNIYEKKNLKNDYNYVDKLSLYFSFSSYVVKFYFDHFLKSKENTLDETIPLMKVKDTEHLFDQINAPLFFYYTSKDKGSSLVQWDLNKYTKGIFFVISKEDKEGSIFFSKLLVIAGFGGKPRLKIVDYCSKNLINYNCLKKGNKIIELDICYDSSQYVCAFFDFEIPISPENISSFHIGEKGHYSFLAHPLPKKLLFNKCYTDFPLKFKNFYQIKLSFFDMEDGVLKISFETDQGISKSYLLEFFLNSKSYGEGLFSLDPYGGEIQEKGKTNILLPREVRRGHYFSFLLSDEGFSRGGTLSGSCLDFLVE